MTTTWPIRAHDVLGLPIRVGAVEIGTVVDVLGSRGLGHVLGLEVLGRDGHHHFVPWVAADVSPPTIGLTSVFALLSSSELALYLDNCVRVREVAPDALIGREGDIEVAEAITSVHLAAKRSMP